MTEATKAEGLLKPYALITERICGMLQEGVVPWRRPWVSGIADPQNLHSGKAYRGINVFMLEATAAMAGYRSRYWVTFRQAVERGGSVRKGEQATPVVFWKILEPGHSGGNVEGAADDEPDRGSARKIPLLRYYNIFNVEQCDGLDYPVPAVTEKTFDPIIACEQIVQSMPRPPTIEHGGERASYSPSADRISMPHREWFIGPEEYYGTLFHEMIHSSGHVSRLNREGIKDRAPFGSECYAKEELIAEMGASFLCSRGHIERETLANSAAYIQGWLKVFRSDPKMVVLAAASAQKATDHILDVGR